MCWCPLLKKQTSACVDDLQSGVCSSLPDSASHPVIKTSLQMHFHSCKIRAWMNMIQDDEWASALSDANTFIKTWMHADRHAQLPLMEARWFNPLVFPAFHIFTPTVSGLELLSNRISSHSAVMIRAAWQAGRRAKQGCRRYAPCWPVRHTGLAWSVAITTVVAFVCPGKRLDGYRGMGWDNRNKDEDYSEKQVLFFFWWSSWDCRELDQNTTKAFLFTNSVCIQVKFEKISWRRLFHLKSSHDWLCLVVTFSVLYHRLACLCALWWFYVFYLKDKTIIEPSFDFQLSSFVWCVDLSYLFPPSV